MILGVVSYRVNLICDGGDGCGDRVRERRGVGMEVGIPGTSGYGKVVG